MDVQRIFGRCSPPAGAGRRGLTLMEVLVALTVSAVLLAVVMRIFGMISGAVAENQARMDMTDRQRAATTLLQADLQGRTALTLPWARLEAAGGYLAYIEGTATDADPLKAMYPKIEDEDIQKLGSKDSMVLGDVDDVLMMTVRSRTTPFTGRGPGGQIIQSPVAEIVWFVESAETGTDAKSLTLYRRVLLVVPHLQVGGSSQQEFFQQYDISARYERGRMISNSLADLTMPENRFAHRPHANLGRFERDVIKPLNEASGRLGEDVVLTNVVAFDIKAYDPHAEVRQSEEYAIVPGDLKFDGQSLGSGAYVDLGAGQRFGGDYAGNMHRKAKMDNLPGILGIYDTWSFHYEHDGVPQGEGIIDQGTDGRDQTGGGVDTPDERETSPPYPMPLRGIQVEVRVYDPVSRQVRRVVVVGEFMPN
jgi:prepilin-type N-terminal cleavage/methylation domain-containing protein